MRQQALGIIETVGLAAAVTAADAAVKAANVVLLGYELSKGGGWTLVKLQGDVGAVKAAIEAAKAAALRVSAVRGTHVIPRPHAEITPLIHSAGTVGLKPAGSAGKEAAPAEVPAVPAASAAIQSEQPEPEQSACEENVTTVPAEAEAELASIDELPAEELPAESDELEDAREPEPDIAQPYSCNICRDSRCQRKKGEPKVTCLHYGKTSEESDEE